MKPGVEKSTVYRALCWWLSFAWIVELQGQYTPNYIMMTSKEMPSIPALVVVVLLDSGAAVWAVGCLSATERESTTRA